MRTERFTAPTALTYRPTGAPLQDFAYAYDLAGNITTIRNRTPGSGVPGTPLGADALDRTFTYDPIYRLLSATGRECDVPPERPPWDDRPRCVDLTKTRGYTESYRYDPEGNLTRLQHQANGGTFTRELALVPNSNRLATVAISQAVYDYAYDANGNLIREATTRHFEWDHGDRMRVFRTQIDGAEPSVHTHYLYDSIGQRVKKLVRKQGGQVEVNVYIDGLFEHQRIVRGGTTRENNTLHVMDNQGRIALVRVGPPFPNDTTPAVKFHLGDHLGGSNVVVDATGELINREEYFPYGETSFGSFARKRYRFTGKERDEESGLYYHGARYYAPWLARWASCDPLGPVDGLNLYRYVRGNPLHLTDTTGTQSMDSDNITPECDPESECCPVDKNYSTAEVEMCEAPPPAEPPLPEGKRPAPAKKPTKAAETDPPPDVPALCEQLDLDFNELVDTNLFVCLNFCGVHHALGGGPYGSPRENQAYWDLFDACNEGEIELDDMLADAYYLECPQAQDMEIRLRELQERKVQFDFDERLRNPGNETCLKVPVPTTPPVPVTPPVTPIPRWVPDSPFPPFIPFLPFDLPPLPAPSAPSILPFIVVPPGYFDPPSEATGA